MACRYSITWETGSTAEVETLVTGGLWSASVAAVGRHGGYGLRVVRASGAGAAIGAYVTLGSNGSASLYFLDDNAASGGTARTPVRFTFYHQTTGLVLANGRLLSLVGSGATAIVGLFNDGGILRYGVTGTGGTAYGASPSAGSWYRLEGELNTLGGLTLNVYTETGSSPLSISSVATFATDVQSIEWGYRPIIGTNSGQVHYFDDLQINDALVIGTGQHTGQPGRLSGLPLVVPNGDGAYKEFDSSAGGGSGSASWAYIDDAAPWPPSDADFNTSNGIAGVSISGTADPAVTTTDWTLTDSRIAGVYEDDYWVGVAILCNGKTLTVTAFDGATGTFSNTTSGWSGGGNPGNGHAWTSGTFGYLRDSWAIPDYAGSNTVRVVRALLRHRGVGPNGGGLHSMALKDGSALKPLRGLGGAGASVYTYRGFILSEAPSGAAWSNARFNACEAYYRREPVQGSEIYAHEVTGYAVLPVEDEGVPPVTGGARRRSGRVQ